MTAREDHGSHTVEDAAQAEHQRAMDDYEDDRPTLADCDRDEARKDDAFWAEHVAEQNADWRTDLRNVPEPPELTAQSEAAAAKRARADQTCTACGERRSAHGWKASELTARCVFVEPHDEENP